MRHRWAPAILAVAAAAGFLGQGVASAHPRDVGAARAAATDSAAPATQRPTASDPVVWLCRPGQRPNPCAGSLRTTDLREPNGPNGRVFTPRKKRRDIDCFYVYPTVSQQPTVLADKSIDPEEVSIAQYQAARFRDVCRVYAPVYRQVTLAGLGGKATEQDWRTAFSDVRQAWRAYLRSDNKGRGFVLIGHSQGAGMLRSLVADVIERHPSQRRRMVSALLLGTAVAVKEGKLVGGDFRHTPGCSRPGQSRCVISYATFGTTPPDGTLFGVVRKGWGQPPVPGYEALCTNPAALTGGSAPLRTLTRSRPIFGALGIAQKIMYGGPPPTAATPWLIPAARYRARCVRRNGASVLLATPMGDAPVLNPSPTPEWGLHLVDVNLPLGDLVFDVRAAARTYASGVNR